MRVHRLEQVTILGINRQNMKVVKSLSIEPLHKSNHPYAEGCPDDNFCSTG